MKINRVQSTLVRIAFGFIILLDKVKYGIIVTHFFKVAVFSLSVSEFLLLGL
ncbi:hypothetical protein ACS127_14580 [Amphibacillus sp. Q70]|uniref:hypothetical protein n=1 Tax=Amphibacillus sp. Q70 TaxID=3453416 RepID=UPI003F829706